MPEEKEVTKASKEFQGGERWVHPTEGSEAFPENEDVVKTLKSLGFKKDGPGERPPHVPHAVPKQPDEDKIAAIEKQLAELKAGR